MSPSALRSCECTQVVSVFHFTFIVPFIFVKAVFLEHRTSLTREEEFGYIWRKKGNLIAFVDSH